MPLHQPCISPLYYHRTYSKGEGHYCKHYDEEAEKFIVGVEAVTVLYRLTASRHQSNVLTNCRCYRRKLTDLSSFRSLHLYILLKYITSLQLWRIHGGYDDGGLFVHDYNKRMSYFNLPEYQSAHHSRNCLVKQFGRFGTIRLITSERASHLTNSLIIFLELGHQHLDDDKI